MFVGLSCVVKITTRDGVSITASEWGDEAVVRRWVKAFPGTRSGEDLERWSEARIVALLANPDKVSDIRGRLGSLSWFMRALNAPIARMANREDHCTGRFWKGRFKSQALLDEQALLSCMAYVDLNPVRAKICDELEESQHTSIAQRIDSLGQADQDASKADRITPLRPVAGLQAELTLSVNGADYLAIVRWTGQQARAFQKFAQWLRALAQLGGDGCLVHVVRILWAHELKGVCLMQLSNGSEDRVPVNLRIRASLREKARLMGVNLSQTLEKSLESEISRREQDAWQQENRAAVEAYNRRIESRGPALSRYRSF